MKVQELEKEILDSREKTEFFRTKMQELVSTLAISLTMLMQTYILSARIRSIYIE